MVKKKSKMRVLASGSIFFESGTVDLLGNFWFPGHFEKKSKSRIFVEKKVFFSDRKPAQKHKRLYQNWSPRSGTKSEKKSKKSKKVTKILVLKKSRKNRPKFWYFFVLLLEKTCFLPIKNLYGKKNPNPKNLKKGSKILDEILEPFLDFFGFGFFLPYKFFISKKDVFSAGGVAAGAFFYEKKGPKFWWNFWTFFGQHFGPFFLTIFWKKHSECSETYLVSQISSRGSGSNFFYPKLIGDR